jgi:hypothetical protein
MGTIHMPHKYQSSELTWRGDRLYAGKTCISRIVPDAKYPDIMWRVVRPDGTLTEMVNRTRAKDAAVSYGLAMLQARHRVLVS